MKQNPNESQIRFLIAKEQKHGKLEQAEQNLLNRLTKEGQKMRGVKDAVNLNGMKNWSDQTLKEEIKNYSASAQYETGAERRKLEKYVDLCRAELERRKYVKEFSKDTAGHGLGDRRARLHWALDKVMNAKLGGPKRQAMDEVPDWPGAASVYRRLYSALDKMREKGHVSAGNFGKGLRGSPGTVSQEMRDIISHLNEGNEQKLKADIHWCMSRGYL